MNRREFIANSCVAAGSLAFAGCGSVPNANGTGLTVGAAKRRVTPPLWVPYLTSSGSGTHASFQGVHDDLFARALVLDDGRDAIAVLAVDSIGYDNALLGPGRDFTAELRRKVAASTALQPDAIMFAATHSHSTPETIGLTPFREVRGVPDWLETHLGELAATVIEAWRNRVPARARAGVTKVEGIARYRRIRLRNGKESRRGPLPPPEDVTVPWRLDEDLNILHFERDDGAPLAVLLNYTAHPVVAMLLPQISADYPGAVTAMVERELPGTVCLFTNGCAGNVNTVKVATNFDDVQSIGATLGRAALGKLRELKPLVNPTVAHHSTELTLAPRECPPLADAEKAAANNPSAKNRVLLRLAKKLAEGPLRAEVQTMRVGPVNWVSLPGEPFVETGFALKATGATFVVGYANGWLGYLPIRRAYDEGGYETQAGAWSRVAPGSAEQLEAAGVACLLTVNSSRQRL
ncbi:MAG: hypothetical protein A2107_10845 [Verrucomicrobia bacterium GWF2_62_7]|nr:MAG: hypothetical protein A2107_10845 [Verrucomicrobia bacterium GWF2_62_7]